MKKLCCVKCNKYRKLKNPRISYIFDETLSLSTICDKCSSYDEKIFKEEESIEILRILSLINNMSE